MEIIVKILNAVIGTLIALGIVSIIKKVYKKYLFKKTKKWFKNENAPKVRNFLDKYGYEYADKGNMYYDKRANSNCFRLEKTKIFEIKIIEKITGDKKEFLEYLEENI